MYTLHGRVQKHIIGASPALREGGRASSQDVAGSTVPADGGHMYLVEMTRYEQITTCGEAKISGGEYTMEVTPNPRCAPSAANPRACCKLYLLIHGQSFPVGGRGGVRSGSQIPVMVYYDRPNSWGGPCVPTAAVARRQTRGWRSICWPHPSAIVSLERPVRR